MTKFKETSFGKWVAKNRVESLVMGGAVTLLVVLVIIALTLPNKAAASPDVAEQPKTVVQAPAVVPPAAPAAPAVKAPVAPVVPQQAKVAETVFTIRQIGGAEEIVKDWHNESATSVKIPVVSELASGWEDIHQVNGSPLYLVAVSSDKGTATYKGAEYFFDKGYVGVFVTSEPESISITTEWNNSAEEPAKRHFNVWSELFVVNSSMDIDETAERLLAEWVETQGKSVGFVVLSDGTVSKIKHPDAVTFNDNNIPLFPEQLPQQAAGSPKAFIMTTTQVGAGSEIMKDWTTPLADAVKIPVEDKTSWQGILMKDSKPLFIVLVSSDAGTVVFEGKNYKLDKGFVAAFVTSEPESIAITTGWNEDNENFNVWAQKFITPDDESIDEVLKEMLLPYKKDQGKELAFGILSDGTEYKP